MAYELTVSFHKSNCSSSNLEHNRRTINVPHSDPSRRHLNVCYIDEPIEVAYEKLFGKATEEYNKGKKPSRQIKNYYQHIMKQYQIGQEKLQKAISSGASRADQRRIKSRYPKPYYELIISIGNSDCYDGAFSVLGEKSDLAAEILNRYMEDFQKRNPHLYVFSAFLHRDETGFNRKESEQTENNCQSKSGINHIHCAVIPWTDLPGRGLPVRVSENGAFIQQGLTTGEFLDYGTIRFQEQERLALSEIMKEYDLIATPNKHSKQHLSKQEYILRKEQEKAKVDAKQIDQEADALLEEQDRFISYVQNSDQAISYLQSLENEELRKKSELQDKAIADAWNEFNQSTSQYFAHYRRQKELLREELLRARKNAHYGRKSLHNLLWDISCTNDFFIVKLFKLLGAILTAVDNIFLEAEVQRLQKANNELKQLAKDIMSDSQGVSAELKTKDVVRIQEAMTIYDQELQNSISRINQLTHGRFEPNER